MKKGEVLKVLKRHQMLTLAMQRRITQREAASELGLSLSHTKRIQGIFSTLLRCAAFYRMQRNILAPISADLLVALR